MSDSTVKRRGALVFKGNKGTSSGSMRIIRSLEACPSSSHVIVDEFVKGDGRIVCSGMTVQGLETRFKEQMSYGDSLWITHPQSLTKEEGIVSSILSQRSLTIESPFSSDFVSTVEYTIRKGIHASKEYSESTIKKEEPSSADTRAHHTYPVGEEVHETDKILTYREKVGMSYRTVAVKVDKNMSKEDLLDLQTKKSHDRYC